MNWDHMQRREFITLLSGAAWRRWPHMRSRMIECGASVC